MRETKQFGKGSSRVKRVRENCLMRCGGAVLQLSNVWSVNDRRICRPIGICERCGHVQIARLFTSEEYGALNARVFAKVHSPERRKELFRANWKKKETVTRRLSEFPVYGGRLLDVGAGEGWSERVARRFGMDYYVVGADPRSSKRLKNQGATIAATTIQDLIPDYLGHFKVIILRHTLEHFLDPIESVETLRICLSEDGFYMLQCPISQKVNRRQVSGLIFLGPSISPILRLTDLSGVYIPLGLKRKESWGEVKYIVLRGEGRVNMLLNSSMKRK